MPFCDSKSQRRSPATLAPACKCRCDLLPPETKIALVWKITTAITRPAPFPPFDREALRAGLGSAVLSLSKQAGEHDRLRASLEPAYQMLRNGEMRVIAGEGLYICDQNPQAAAEILKSYFKE